MATKTNKITAAFIKQKLNALYDARVVWENGVYKTSNDELYNLLDKCLVLFKELANERSLIKELNELLEARGAKLTNGTSLATKIVRYVFDGCSAERSYTYARVLTVANAEKDDKVSMRSFVISRNGVEAIRKAPKDGSLSAAQKAKSNADHAEKHYANAKALAPSFTSNDAGLHPNTEAANDFAVALVRKNNDGSLSIVFGTNNKALVGVVLAEAGKAAQQADNEDDATKQQALSRKARNAAVNAAVADAKLSKAKTRPSLKLAA
jgi:hypothetical protein